MRPGMVPFLCLLSLPHSCPWTVPVPPGPSGLPCPPAHTPATTAGKCRGRNLGVGAAPGAWVGRGSGLVPGTPGSRTACPSPPHRLAQSPSLPPPALAGAKSSLHCTAVCPAGCGPTVPAGRLWSWLCPGAALKPLQVLGGRSGISPHVGCELPSGVGWTVPPLVGSRTRSRLGSLLTPLLRRLPLPCPPAATPVLSGANSFWLSGHPWGCQGGSWGSVT